MYIVLLNLKHGHTLDLHRHHELRIFKRKDIHQNIIEPDFGKYVIRCLNFIITYKQNYIPTSQFYTCLAEFNPKSHNYCVVLNNFSSPDPYSSL